ncbi:MAG: hypothetical protein NTX03_02565 [Bacteroidetes bacterium]|nr:hypothetical protein [Bacteroidota bacterium]
MNKSFLILVAILISFNAFAGDDSTSISSPPKKKWKLIAGVDAGNNFTYRSSVDTLTHPYLYPNLYYKNPNGFNASIGAFTIGNDNVKRLFTEIDLSAGWDFYIGKHADVGASYSYSYFFVNKNGDRDNDLLTFSLSNDINAYAGFDFWSVVYSDLSFDYAWGKVPFESVNTNKYPKRNLTDNYITWTNSHEFAWDYIFTDDDGITLTPTICISGGTNNYLVQAEKIHKIKTGKKSKKNVAQDAAFNLLSYTFSLPLRYDIGAWGFTFKYKFTYLANQPAEAEIKYYSLFKASVSYRIH